MSRPVFIITPSGAPDGIHSGRPRLRVYCLACMRTLHEATTGAQTRMEHHLRVGCKNDDVIASPPDPIIDSAIEAGDVAVDVVTPRPESTRELAARIAEDAALLAKKTHPHGSADAIESTRLLAIWAQRVAEVVP